MSFTLPELLCCDTCVNSYHPKCLGLNDPTALDGKESWYCPVCVRKRTSSCLSPSKSPRPLGREKRGVFWDKVRGVWVPSESSSLPLIKDLPKKVNYGDKACNQEDGTVLPAVIKKLPNGLFARPIGRQRKGIDWDEVCGLWVPIPIAGSLREEAANA